MAVRVDDHGSDDGGDDDDNDGVTAVQVRCGCDKRTKLSTNDTDNKAGSRASDHAV